MQGEGLKAQKDLDQACQGVGALCELLQAAQHEKVSAASIHALLKPISVRLDTAASALDDLRQSV